jgi:hypothetical protein
MPYQIIYQDALWQTTTYAIVLLIFSFLVEDEKHLLLVCPNTHITKQINNQLATFCQKITQKVKERF